VGWVIIITITSKSTILWTLYAIHLKVDFMLCILIYLDSVCTLKNSLSLTQWFQTYFMDVQNLILSIFNFIFLYMLWIFHINILSYLDGTILNHFSFSLTNIWLYSLSYVLFAISITGNFFICDVCNQFFVKSMKICFIHLVILQIW
jgi:hypothetical protein